MVIRSFGILYSAICKEAKNAGECVMNPFGSRILNIITTHIASFVISFFLNFFIFGSSLHKSMGIKFKNAKTVFNCRTVTNDENHFELNV